MSLAQLTEDIQPRRAALSSAESTPQSGVSQAFEALSKFIPAEILAPYIALLAYAAEGGAPSPRTAYFLFVIATPLLTALLLYARHAKEGRPWPPRSRAIWRSSAAMIAALVWGLAPPGSAFQSVVGGPVLAGILAMFISPVLTAVDAIVLRTLGDTQGAGHSA